MNFVPKKMLLLKLYNFMSTLGANRPIEGSILKKPQIIPEGSDEVTASTSNGVINTNNSARLLSHPSAASIASSTESSAGESGSGGISHEKKEASIKPASIIDGEVEVASTNHTNNTASATQSNIKKSTLMSNTGNRQS